ncbi:MAG: PAS domain S-box protein [Nitrospira sp.]|nr:PAS domain S-box protein [Nitrospira sp.]
MQSCPIPEDEAARLAELHACQILDTPPDEAYDNLAKLAAQLCGTPIALIGLIDTHRAWFKAKVGVDWQEIPRNHATFCGHVIDTREPLVVPDAGQDPRFADSPLVVMTPHIRFYAGVPLLTSSGHAVGTLCVLDQTPRQLTESQLNGLRLLSRQVVSRLELRRRQYELEYGIVRHQKDDREKGEIIREIDQQRLAGLAFVNQDGRYTHMNSSYAAIYEYTADELIGRSWKAVHSPEWGARIEREGLSVLSQRGRWSGEVHGLTKSGRTVYVDISFVLSREELDPDRWLMCICHDVTARVLQQRQLEANQQNLAQAQALAHVGSWEWDIEAGTEIWSDEQFRIFGYAPQSFTPTIETFRQAIHPDDQGKVFQAVEEALRQNRLYEVTCRILRPTGESRYILCHGAVTRNPNGLPTRMAGTVQDITEQKLLEQTMNDSIQRLNLATKSGGIGIWDYYIQTNKMVWDRRMYELYAYTIEDFPGTYEAWSSRFHLEDKPHVKAAIQAAIETQCPFDMEFRITLPNIGIRHIKASAVVLTDEAQNASRMIGVNYDITARKESEITLRELHNFREAILLHAPHAMIAFSTTGIIQHFNPAAEKLLRYHADEMIRRSTPTVFHDPDEVVSRAQSFGAELGIALEPGFEVLVAKARLNLPNQHEWTYIRKDGSQVPVLLSVTAIRDYSGAITGFLGMAIDVTAQKTAEASRHEQETRLRAIVDHAVDGIITIDEWGTIETFNSAAERLFGHTAAELIGRNIRTLMPAPYHSEHDGYPDDYRQTTHANVIGRPREVLGYRKDGSTFPLELAVSEMRLGDRRLFTGITRDLTERKDAEAKLELAAFEADCRSIELIEVHKQAVAATKAKSEFLASMSHEIRTPMNAIVGMADLLQETSLTTTQQEYVGRFSRAATSLLDLINNILDISKIEAGHLELESVAFNIHDLTDEIAELMAVRAQANQLELGAFVHPDVPTLVSGDPTRLRQILVNLIGNAIKFTEHGEVVIRIEPDTTMPETLRCSVRDTGIGISADKLDSIFESFSQVDSSTTRKYGGSGLGLSISKYLVELMGGRLAVESHTGIGSVFSFTLRLPKAPASAAASPLPSLDLRKRRLLLVDNTETNRMIVREHLKSFGPTIVEASDGPTALDLFDEAVQRGMPFDLAILDYHMPKMDGLTLAQAIRERVGGASLPLILSASDLREQASQCARDLGITAYVYKPICRKRLLESLAVALNQGPVRPAQSESDLPSTPSSLSPYRILLVEDLEDNRDVIALFLNGTACRLDMAENGAVALQKFQTGTYDLIFMDIQMPVMDGIQATAAIRQWEREHQRRPTPIVALTANAFKEEADRSLRAGCTAHVTKPVKKATVLATIAKYGNNPTDQAA